MIKDNLVMNIDQYIRIHNTNKTADFIDPLQYLFISIRNLSKIIVYI
jgi:hypothetical protein